MRFIGQRVSIFLINGAAFVLFVVAAHYRVLAAAAALAGVAALIAFVRLSIKRRGFDVNGSAQRLESDMAILSSLLLWTPGYAMLIDSGIQYNPVLFFPLAVTMMTGALGLMLSPFARFLARR